MVANSFNGSRKLWHIHCFCLRRSVTSKATPGVGKLKLLCNKYIRDALEIARQLIILADEGDLDSEDDGCRVLYGVVRDCAYKIRAQADREREDHKQRGVWNDAEMLVNNSKEYNREWSVIKKGGEVTGRVQDYKAGNISGGLFGTGNYK